MTAHTPGGLVKTSVAVRADQLVRMDRIAHERNVTRGVIHREAIDNELKRLERGDPVLIERAG